MDRQGKRIFIVEDEVVVAFEMTDTLEDLGFTVVGPSVHLADAETRAKQEDIDVAFLDVNLGANKTTQSVAELLEDRGIPFVFITAYDRDQIDFLKGKDRLIKKPVSSDKLLSALQDLLTET